MAEYVSDRDIILTLNITPEIHSSDQITNERTNENQEFFLKNECNVYNEIKDKITQFNVNNSNLKYLYL